MPDKYIELTSPWYSAGGYDAAIIERARDAGFMQFGLRKYAILFCCDKMIPTSQLDWRCTHEFSTGSFHGGNNALRQLGAMGYLRRFVMAPTQKGLGQLRAKSIANIKEYYYIRTPEGTKVMKHWAKRYAKQIATVQKAPTPYRQYRTPYQTENNKINAVRYSKALSIIRPEPSPHQDSDWLPPMAPLPVVTGYREYQTDMKGNMTGSYGQPWKTGSLDAVCHAVNHDPAEYDPPLTDEERCQIHLLSDMCTCGIYMTKAAALLPSGGENRLGTIYTETIGSGAILPYENGWKVSHATINRIWVPEIFSEAFCNLLSDKYGCPVVTTASAKFLGRTVKLAKSLLVDDEPITLNDVINLLGDIGGS